MLTRTHTQTHKLSWLPDEISSVPSLSSQLQGPITTLQACQPLLTAMRRWKWKGRMGGGFWKYLEEGVHFIAAIETLWMLSLSDLSDRIHQQLADAVSTRAVFYICWIYFYVCLGFFFFFTKRELNIVIMLYPVLFAIHHSILSHPSPSVSCCTSLCKDWAVQNGKDLKRVTQITLVFDDQLYEPYCKTHTHTPQGDGHRVLPKAILSISLTFAHFSGVKANLPHTRAHTQPSISCSVFLTLFLFTPSGTPF